MFFIYNGIRYRKSCNKCLKHQDNFSFFKSNINVIFRDVIPDGYRYCNKCGKLLPLDKEHFRRKKNGFWSNCKVCAGSKSYGFSLGKINVNLVKDDLKVCHNCNIIKSIYEFPYECHNRRSTFCNDCIKVYKDNKREYDKNYFIANKDKKKKYYSEWKNNGGQIIRNINNRKRSAKILLLKHDFTKEEWLEVLDYFNYSCAYCGLTEEESIIIYNKKLCQEHVIPVIDGGEYTKGNIVPACCSCNTSKCQMSLEKFYVHKDVFTENNYNNILMYLNSIY